MDPAGRDVLCGQMILYAEDHRLWSAEEVFIRMRIINDTGQFIQFRRIDPSGIDGRIHDFATEDMDHTKTFHEPVLQ